MVECVTVENMPVTFDHNVYLLRASLGARYCYHNFVRPSCS